MKNFKVYVKDAETSEKVQRKAIDLGYGWAFGGQRLKELGRNFLHLYYLDIFGKLMSYSSTFECFRNEDAIELTPEEFLRLTPADLEEDLITINPPKEKIIVKEVLKAGDIVIVRDADYKRWGGRCFFSHYMKDTSTPYFTELSCYKQCLPYNKDTKYLIGTNKPAPENYII